MEIVNPDDIQLPPWKIKDFDNNIYTKLLNTIRQVGQIRNITICDNPLYSQNQPGSHAYILIEGRNILRACKELEMPAIYAKNVGVVDEIKAMELCLAINEIDFRTDFVDLGEMLKIMVEKSSLVHASRLTMYDLRECKKFIDLLNFDWEEFNRKKIKGKPSLFDL